MTAPSPPHSTQMYGIKVSNLDYQESGESLRNMFSNFGEIGDAYVVTNPVTHRSRGFGFVKFLVRQEALNAAFTMNGMVVRGRVLHVYPVDRNLRRSLAQRIRDTRSSSSSESPTSSSVKFRTIKVENLHYMASVDDIRRFFQYCGPISDVHIPKYRKTERNRGYGFVTFYRKDDAYFAIETLNNTKLRGRTVQLMRSSVNREPQYSSIRMSYAPLAVRFRRL